MEERMMNAEEQCSLAFLKEALPEADRISISEEDLLRVVRHAQRVRREAPWGGSIPEDVFRAYVLFPRVNNEDFVFYHETIWEELSPRLQGMGMEEAVREVNIWTFDRATYQSTDDRTANALTVLKRTFGRCGEESTLLVSALRSVGIPARQIYVPRWAHCDDNHAWVEAWVDGVWHYLGACEPEPELDVAWFTAPASKAMLVHTRAYGVAPAGEQVVNRIGSAFVINRTEAYAKTCRMTVRVTENGAPKPGVWVRFELANMAELYPINIQRTDEEGMAALVTGLGTLHLHVHDGARYICRMVDATREQYVEIDFGGAEEFDRQTSRFDQRPPEESRMQATEFSDEQMRIHGERMKLCDLHRAAYKATFATEDPDLARACGNHDEIRAFLEDKRFAEADKRLILSKLRDKDFIDATAAMLSDALESALPFRGEYPEVVWQESVLAPRIWNEPLRPVRTPLRSMLMELGWAERSDGLTAMEKGRALWAMLSERVEICEMDPPNLYPELTAILPAGRASCEAMDALFVAAARAVGLAARLNPANEAKEVWSEGAYCPLIPGRKADAMLVLVEKSGRELQYGVHFSVGVLENGAFRTLHLYGSTLKGRLEIPVFAGKYRVLTCMRQIDGAIDGAKFPVEIASGETAELEVELRRSRVASRIVPVMLPQLSASLEGERVLLPLHGRQMIVAYIAPGQEPTEHFLNELLEDREELLRREINVRLLIEGRKGMDNEKLKRVLESMGNVRLLTDVKLPEVIAWRRLMRAGELRLMPFVAAVDAGGNGLFATAGYRVGSVKTMIQVLEGAE